MACLNAENPFGQFVVAKRARFTAGGAHILQLYDSDDFLSAAVAHFAAAGLQAEEVVLLTGTRDHLASIERNLRSAGVDLPAAERNGQLILSDVHESIVRVVTDGRLEPAEFDAVACGALEEALERQALHAVCAGGARSPIP